MMEDFLAVSSLLAEYGALCDAGEYDKWLGLFAEQCSYFVKPRENEEQGLPVSLIHCANRKMLEDRLQALRIASKYNIHNDRHIIGLPRMISSGVDHVVLEAPFAVYQTEQEGETRLFATGLYRDHLKRTAHGLKFAEKMVLVDSFAIPTLLATPL